MPLDEENLVFIVSMPRSGSTLLQRALMTQVDFRSTAESWLLLPLMYARKPEGVYSLYGHKSAVAAIGDFCQHLPRGEADFSDMLRNGVLDLFGKVKPTTARFFIEKTPRNALVLEDIIATFPRSKYIFLWRNPLACVSSMVETFGAGRWGVNRYNIDLFEGFSNLVEHFGTAAVNKCAVRYEDFVTSPAVEIQRLTDFVGASFDLRRLESFGNVKLDGRMGDPTGPRQYATITSATLGKWKMAFASPVRKRWARNYLKWLGPERLATIGYDHGELMNDLDGIRNDLLSVPQDFCWQIVSALSARFHPRVMYGGLQQRKRLGRPCQVY